LALNINLSLTQAIWPIAIDLWFFLQDWRTHCLLCNR